MRALTAESALKLQKILSKRLGRELSQVELEQAYESLMGFAEALMDLDTPEVEPVPKPPKKSLHKQNYLLQETKKVSYSMYRVDGSLTMKKGFITVKQAAEILGVSVQTIIRWDKSGKLKASRHPMNNYRLYRLVEIRKLAEEIGEK